MNILHQYFMDPDWSQFLAAGEFKKLKGYNPQLWQERDEQGLTPLSYALMAQTDPDTINRIITEAPKEAWQGLNLHEIIEHHLKPEVRAQNPGMLEFIIQNAGQQEWQVMKRGQSALEYAVKKLPPEIIPHLLNSANPAAFSSKGSDNINPLGKIAEDRCVGNQVAEEGVAQFKRNQSKIYKDINELYDLLTTEKRVDFQRISEAFPMDRGNDYAPASPAIEKITKIYREITKEEPSVEKLAEIEEKLLNVSNELQGKISKEPFVRFISFMKDILPEACQPVLDSFVKWRYQTMVQEGLGQELLGAIKGVSGAEQEAGKGPLSPSSAVNAIPKKDGPQLAQ